MLIPSISRHGRVALFATAWAQQKKTVSGTRTILRVSVEEQYRTNWCWLAAGLGVAQSYGTARTRTQCLHAGRILSMECCPDGEGCNDPGDVSDALEGHLNEPVIDSKGHQTMDFVREEIDRGNPIAVRIHRRDAGAGHFVVIGGYREESGFSYVRVCDPESGLASDWAFEMFRDHYTQNGYWHLSYKTDGGTVPELCQPKGE